MRVVRKAPYQLADVVQVRKSKDGKTFSLWRLYPYAQTRVLRGATAVECVAAGLQLALALDCEVVAGEQVPVGPDETE